MNKRIYSDKELNLLYDITYSSRQIYELTGIPPSTIKRFRQKHNIIYPTRLISDDDESLQQFIKNYKELKSESRMAKLYNVGRHVIGDYVKRHNLQYLENKRGKLSEEEIKYINDMYYTKSSSVIAEELNINQSTVSAVWFRYGLRNKDRRIYELNQNYFSDIDNDDKAYFLGFISSDGCLYTPNDGRQKILTISIHQQDEAILKVFQDDLQTTKPIGRLGDMCNLSISSDKIVDDIVSLGITQHKKTYGNIIPEIDEKYFFSFIRGMIDGDGTISDKNEYVSIAGYKTNLIKIQDFLARHNIFTNFVVDKRKYTTNIFNDPFGSLRTENKTSTYCLLKKIYENKTDHYLTRKCESAQILINKIENSTKIIDKQIMIYYENAVQKVSWYLSELLSGKIGEALQ